MNDEVKETRLDNIAIIGWAYAGYPVGALATIIALMNLWWWFFP